MRNLILYQFFYFLFVIQIIFNNSEPCPNDCSQHGRCITPDTRCECFDQYTGADCSLLVCPQGSAWVDLAIAIDDAHNFAECSNMGICDRTTGKCDCRDGFEGNACERLSCPNKCNNVGECLSMNYYATTKDPGSGKSLFIYSNSS